MSCEHLVCAACAGPVTEGRCPTCRASRAHVHGSPPDWLTPQLLAAILLLLTLAAVLVLQQQV